LLHYSARQLGEGVHSVYLNCEDFKRQSFPNVLIEILRALFAELEKHLSAWFGRKGRSKELIKKIRSDLADLQNKADQTEASVKATSSAELSGNASTELGAGSGLKALAGFSGKSRDEVERVFQSKHDKLEKLDKWLPRLKQQIREFFELSDKVSAIYLQIDDLYQLRQEDQPFVVDYIHRLCKDVPLFFKMQHCDTRQFCLCSGKGSRLAPRKGMIFNP
jgi:chromosome segregation ATPase